MTPISNPCYGCEHRHPECHCKGKCGKGDAYEKFREYGDFISEQRVKEVKSAPYFKRTRATGSKFDFGSREN